MHRSRSFRLASFLVLALWLPSAAHADWLDDVDPPLAIPDEAQLFAQLAYDRYLFPRVDPLTCEVFVQLYNAGPGPAAPRLWTLRIVNLVLASGLTPPVDEGTTAEFSAIVLPDLWLAYVSADTLFELEIQGPTPELDAHAEITLAPRGGSYCMPGR